jgi:hypothetical protein
MAHWKGSPGCLFFRLPLTRAKVRVAQSSGDRWMALRMQVYVGLLYQDLVKRRRLGRNGKLPPVLPIVLYAGERPWRASKSVSGLVLAPPAGLEWLQPERTACRAGFRAGCGIS